MKDNKQRIIHFRTTIQFFVNKKEADKNEKKKKLNITSDKQSIKIKCIKQ